VTPTYHSGRETANSDTISNNAWSRQRVHREAQARLSHCRRASTAVNRLIIVAPNWLGDAVMALPAIADVRRGLPDATIVVTARESVAPLFDMVADVDEVVAQVESKRTGREQTVRVEADTAILLPNSFRSALLARRAGIAQRWGYRTDWRGLLLTRAIARPRSGIHQIEYYQRLTHALGFPSGPSTPRLHAPSTARAAAACVLARAGWDGKNPFVALSPGAAYGGAKRWPPDRFAAVARVLESEGIRSVLVGSAADVPTGRQVESASRGDTSIVNVIGRTDLAQLAGLLSMARALVSNDSGAMHLGAALGVPVVAVFGPTDERVTAPHVPRRSAESGTAEASDVPTAVLTSAVWCRPCMLRECPIDHRCMRRISVETVLDATRRML
jgi:heptosyltransferase II